jgi:NADP-dependent 3-hydroxy acid dehydrogenase YdfG
MQEILITGAGSGFGEGTALGLAQKGHNVIAAVQTWPQVTALREKAGSTGLKTLRIEKLDLLDTYDVAHALKWKFEILVNNAGIAREDQCLKSPSTWSERTSKQASSRLWILHNAW